MCNNNKKAAGGNRAACQNSMHKHCSILPYRKQFVRSVLPEPVAFYSNFFSKISKPNTTGWAVTRCCFHYPDKHPSLSINLNNGAFRCLSCGVKGGGLIDFYMRLHGVDFKTAIQALSRGV